MILDKIFDKALGKVTGKLEKMIIMGFKDSDEAAKGNATSVRGGNSKVKQTDTYYEAFINPENYTLNYTVNFDCNGKRQGTGGRQAKFTSLGSEVLTFKFLFDDTGIIDGDIRDILKKPSQGVFEDVQKFRKLLVGLNGETHQTPVQVLVWGNLIFTGRATELSLEYKLFNSNGEPIRAEANVKFIGTVNENKEAAKLKKSSPDLTHIVQVKAGDTLPLLCKKVYGDPRYYFQVAAANGLGNFRRLEPGMDLVFPPIDKTAN